MLANSFDKFRLTGLAAMVLNFASTGSAGEFGSVQSQQNTYLLLPSLIHNPAP